MINKKNFLIILSSILVAFLLVYFYTQSKNNISTNESYPTVKETNNDANHTDIKNSVKKNDNSIDYTCVKNSDCVIKNVYNCCGAYPKCVNKNAIINSNFASQNCSKEGFDSICGFPSIDSCQCINSKCEGFSKK